MIQLLKSTRFARRCSCFLRAMSASVKIHGVDVPVTASCQCQLQDILNNPNFTNWVNGIDEGLLVKSIDIQNVDYFGNGRIGFIKFKSLVYKASNPEGRHVPGIVFMRGPSVAILIVLKCNGKKYTILTRQPRVPIANSCFTEIPAGVFDGEAFGGVAAKELKEEVGLTINASDLVDMTKEVYGDRYPGMYPSPGGCDEYIKLFLYEKEVSEAELNSFQNKATGLMEEGEYICLKVIELDDLVRETSDAKALCALALYNQLHSLECSNKQRIHSLWIVLNPSIHPSILPFFLYSLVANVKYAVWPLPMCSPFDRTIEDSDCITFFEGTNNVGPCSCCSCCCSSSSCCGFSSSPFSLASSGSSRFTDPFASIFSLSFVSALLSSPSSLLLSVSIAPASLALPFPFAPAFRSRFRFRVV